MFIRALVIWVAGLFTIVPGAAYYLLFYAEREQYVWLVGLILVWVFGFWTIVGPVLAGIRAQRVLTRLEQANSRSEIIETLETREAQDAIIDLIASDTHLPRFFVRFVCLRLRPRLSTALRSRQNPAGRTLE
ncbi:MAG TPA: hypothetical protein VFY29_18620 [Terriglobia bacterium]|nr:hypothetical protein [Terriglobia bacterium]